MRAALLAALLGALAAPVVAGENPGVTAAPVLQVPMGSRALGMGSAFTAVASDVSALFYNPAGLSRLSAHEVGFSFLSGLTDNYMQHIAYGGPIPFTGISGNGYASVGGSLLFSQNGSIEVNALNPDGTLGSSQNVSAGSDFVADLGYAERVGATPVDVRETTYGINHFVGVGGKYLKSTLVGGYTGHALSADVGYLVQSPEAGVSFGLAAQNIGGRLRYIDAADPLPTTIRSGLAYQGGIPGVHTFTLSTDGEYLLQERTWRAEVGAEYFLLKSYGVRIGYQFLRDTVGLTAGFGLRWHARILLDYAWTMGRSLNDTQRVTLSYRFGGVAPSARAKARRPFIERAPDREQLHEHLDEKQPELDNIPTPRATPRQDQPGVPGWIY